MRSLGQLGWRGQGAAAPVEAAVHPWEPVNHKSKALDNVLAYQGLQCFVICLPIPEGFTTHTHTHTRVASL